MVAFVNDAATTSSRAIVVVGLGFIGRRIASQAVAAGFSVREIERRALETPIDGVEEYVTEVSGTANLAKVFADSDHVVFAAGTSRPADTTSDPMRECVNSLEPLVATLDAASEAGIRHFTFLSSGGTVYGPNAPDPASEDAPLWPSTPYGVFKVAGERLVAMYARRHGFTADILRCSNVYGPGQPTSGSQGVIGVFLERIRRGDAITLFGSDEASRDFIHVDDLSSIVVRLGGKRDGVRVLNVGSGEPVTLGELIDLIGDLIRAQPIVNREPARTGDVPAVRLDTSNLRATIDVDPRPLSIGIEELAAEALAR
jgi:UDP-glucose 4-epimerase